MLTPEDLPNATELTHAPELAILIALETALAMTTVTIELSLPELDLAEHGRDPCHAELHDRDLIVAHDILRLIDELRRAIKLYRELVLRPATISSCLSSK